MMFMRIYYFVIITAIIILVWGCAPREVVKEEDDDRFTDALIDYEQEFDPSDYNTPFILQQDEEDETTVETDRLPQPDREEPDAPDYTQGFRIQLYSTSDMEAAQEVLEVADSVFTDHWVYIVYEVPFYKVRLGDFETRFQANRILANVVQEGFRDAWVVPDRVVKDPPEKIIEDEEADQNEDIRIEEFEEEIDP